MDDAPCSRGFVHHPCSSLTATLRAAPLRSDVWPSMTLRHNHARRYQVVRGIPVSFCPAALIRIAPLLDEPVT